MKRRDFLKSTLLPLSFSADGFSHVPGTGSLNREALDSVFYDERFKIAEQLAREITGSGHVVPVRGDVTPVWYATLKSANQRAPLMLAGVTTESFHFCLKTLMQSHVGLDITTSRVDRDLIAWSIRSYQSNSQEIT